MFSRQIILVGILKRSQTDTQRGFTFRAFISIHLLSPLSKGILLINHSSESVSQTSADRTGISRVSTPLLARCSHGLHRDDTILSGPPLWSFCFAPHPLRYLLSGQMWRGQGTATRPWPFTNCSTIVSSCPHFGHSKIEPFPLLEGRCLWRFTSRVFWVQNGQIPLAFSCFRPQLGQIIGGILRERPWLVFPADVS